MSDRVRLLAERTPARRAGTAPIPTGLELAGLAVAAAAFAFWGGSEGTLAGVALAVLWIVLPAEYVFAAGQVALVVVVPGQVGLELLVGVEAGLAILVLGSLRAAVAGPLVLAGWTLTYAAVATVVWLVGTANTVPVWQVAAGLWSLVAVAVYGLHRYEVVAMERAVEDNQ